MGFKMLAMDVQCSIPAVPIPILYLSGGIRPDKDTRYAIVASESLDDDSVKRWAHRKWLWDSLQYSSTKDMGRLQCYSRFDSCLSL